MARGLHRLSLHNRQQTRPVRLPLLRQITRAVLMETWPHGGYDLCIYLVTASEITRLNETFLRHKGSTDVITFDYTERAEFVARPAAARASPALLHGEIFICMDEAASQARRFHTIWQSELVRYVVHGVLHLLGYDDHAPRARRRMRAAENALVSRLARQFAFRALGQR